MKRIWPAALGDRRRLHLPSPVVPVHKIQVGFITLIAALLLLSLVSTIGVVAVHQTQAAGGYELVWARAQSGRTLA